MPTKKGKNAAMKSSVKRRSVNASGTAKKSRGAPFSDQDEKRRLGNFNSAGEHSRIGGRTAGIVGQTKQKSRTDNRLTQKSKKKLAK